MSSSSTVILARVSSKSQEDEGYSLDSQVKLLTNYCEQRNLIVIKTFKIAETASKVQSRKVFQELLTYLKKNKIHNLAVEKTDRLTRNLRDAVAIDDWLEADEKRRLHAVKESLLLHRHAKSDVKFMWNIHLAVAKKYTDNLREEAMKGWAEKLAQGWLPAPPPPGYKTITDNGKRIHVPDEETSLLVQRMFKLYLQPGQSIITITAEMEKIGLRSRKGRPFAKSHVQKILINPFYIGVNRFDGKDYPGAQAKLISEDLFSKVQAKMHHLKPPVYKKHNPIFKNIIYCGACRKMVTWQIQKGRFYGSCQRTTQACKDQGYIREDHVEESIEKMLRKLVCPSKELIDWVSSQMQEHYESSAKQREAIRASIKAQIDRISRMDEELYDDKLAGEISKDKYEQKHEEFMTQKAAHVEELEKHESSSRTNLEQRLVLLELSQKAYELYPKKTIDQKRIIITKLFKEVVSKEGFVSVKYTNFAKAIADKVQLTTKTIGV